MLDPSKAGSPMSPAAWHWGGADPLDLEGGEVQPDTSSAILIGSPIEAEATFAVNAGTLIELGRELRGEVAEQCDAHPFELWMFSAPPLCRPCRKTRRRSPSLRPLKCHF